MKVVGTGDPRMLTVRLKPCEIAVLRDELHERRSVVTEAAASAQAKNRPPRASAYDREEVENHHGELILISRLLDQLRTPPPPGQPRQIVGPTWLVGEVIRGAAYEAVNRLASAVDQFREDRGTPTPDELRAAVETASALTATLIGLDYAENHAVE
jgi:hypothetical protein